MWHNSGDSYQDKWIRDSDDPYYSRDPQLNFHDTSDHRVYSKGHYNDSGSGMKGWDNMVEKIAESKEKIKKSKEEQLHTAEEIPVIKHPAPDADSNKSSTADFLIVGIGASAGGLAAFENFFSAISDDTNPGVAFVVLQHLDPTHKSMLTELIGR